MNNNSHKKRDFYGDDDDSLTDSLTSSNDKHRVMTTMHRSTLPDGGYRLRGIGGLDGQYSGQDTLNSFLYDN